MIIPTILFSSLDFSGKFSYESDGKDLDYNIGLGIRWSLKTNSIYTRVNINNDNNYDSISLLNRFELKSLLGSYAFPYLIIVNDLFLNYYNETANRLLTGLGFAIKIFPNSKTFSFSIESGINSTWEMNTDIDAGMTTFWWRSRLKAKLIFSPIISFKIDIVYSYLLDSSYNGIWKQNIAAIIFKVSNKIDFELSIKEYDYEILRLGSGINTDFSIKIKL